MRHWNSGTGWLGMTLGYVIVYHPGVANFCPGCSHSHWHVGRHTAECANCGTALPIAMTGQAYCEPPPTGWRALLPAFRTRALALYSHQ